MLTKQEMFNAAWLGLKAQGFHKALNHNGDCVYRAPNGTRCAIGHVLPNALYRPEMDDVEAGGTNVENLIKRFPEICGLFGKSKRMVDFLLTLQNCHDGGYYDEPEDMERSLRLFAKCHRLAIPTEG